MIPYAQLFYQAADAAQVSPYLLMAMARYESSFDPRAVSEAGAKGIAQFTDETWQGAWKRWGDPSREGDPFDPEDAIPIMSHYVRWLVAQTKGEWWAVVAYNWGIGQVNDLRSTGGSILDVPSGSFRYAVKVLLKAMDYREMLEEGTE